jgi:hypothetical protein
MTPLAVEIAAREGARVVWMPTTDSHAEREHLAHQPPGANLPVWAKVQAEFAERGIETEAVSTLDEGGELLAETRLVLEVIAEHQLVLATGHLGRDEIFTVVDAALAAGVHDVVVTHPEFPSQDLSLADQAALAERGALLERCFTTAHTGKCAWEHVVAGIRATGPERNVLSTDLGQPANPAVEDGLALFADRLLALGLTEEEIRVMTVENSTRLAG